MKLRRQPLLLATAVGVVLLVAWWWPRSHGPTYQGRDVRQWLLLQEQEGPPGQPMISGGGGYELRADALAAFQAMGDQAVAPLVELALTPHPDSRRYRALSWLWDHAAWLAMRLPAGVDGWLRSGQGTRDLAYDAIDRLRPSAAVLIPLLTNQLSRPHPECEEALRMLAAVGDQPETAARMLVPFLANSPALTAKLLRGMGPASAVALPELMTRLPQADSAGSLEIIKCLAAIGPAASNALPDIRVRRDAETTGFHRLDIALGALQISWSEAWAEAEVRAALEGTNRWLLRAAVSSLRDRTNLVSRFEAELRGLALRDAADRDVHLDLMSNSIEEMAVQALGTASLDRRRVLPVLVRCLRSVQLRVRIRAADKLLELEPTNAPAFAFLDDALTRPTRPRDVLRGEYFVVGLDYDRLLVRLGKIAPLNPEARRTLDRLKISATVMAEAEARLVQSERPGPE